jgi:hypothetical protein
MRLVDSESDSESTACDFHVQALRSTDPAFTWSARLAGIAKRLVTLVTDKVELEGDSLVRMWTQS